MYLAEDRVMWLEILRKYSSDYVLRYIPSAIALTDPPDDIITFIKQRRRWTNGSLFASWYVIDHLNMINRSGHSWTRRFSLFILYIYMIASFIFSLLLVGSLFATFSIFIRSFFSDEDCSSFGVAKLFESLYLGILFVFTLMAITKPIQESNLIYSLIIYAFGIFIFISFGFGVKFFWEESKNSAVGIVLAATLVISYVVPWVLNCTKMNPFKYILGIIILMFLAPMYINIIIIYSMANLHDISWGNREVGDQKKSEETRKNLEQFRALYLIVWIFLNAVYGYAIIYINRSGQKNYIQYSENISP